MYLTKKDFEKLDKRLAKIKKSKNKQKYLTEIDVIRGRLIRTMALFKQPML